jgi:hypothetical protein
MNRRACLSAAPLPAGPLPGGPLRGGPGRATAIVLVLAAGLAGCADVQRAMETPRINVESPVAAEVAAGADRNYATPLLRDVPPVPKNLPQPGDVKGQVAALVACRRAMAGYVVDHPPLSGEPAAFAANARAVAAITEADVPPADSAAKAEAFAAQLRAEAAPPAAIASGPAPTPQEAMPPAPAAPPAPSPARKPHAAPKPVAAAPAPAAAPPAAASTPPSGPPAEAVAVPAAVPPLPAPLNDPLLARCT